MKNTIQMVSDSEFKLLSRGNEFTLKFNQDDADIDYMPWTMECFNASTRAYRGPMPSMKYFSSLEDVERNYKSWRGISELVLSLDTVVH